MSDNNFPEVVDGLLKGMSSVLTTKTVVGEPIMVGDTIILPLVDVSFGIGAGTQSKSGKNGNGGGMGAKMTPSAVLIIKDGYTRLVNIKNQDTITKLMDIVPDLVDRFSKKKPDDFPEDEDAVEIAFPDEAEK